MRAAKTSEMRRWAPRILCALASMSAWLIPGEVSAWEYESCSSVEVTPVDNTTPQALIMLDRSGSMTALIEQEDSYPNGWFLVFDPYWINDAKVDITQSQAAAWADPNPSCSGSTCTAPFINQTQNAWPIPADLSYGRSYCSFWFWNVPCSSGSAAKGTWFEESGSLWGVARREIGQAIAQYNGGGQPAMNFGLGTFSTYYNYDYVAPSSMWARVWSEASDYVDPASFMEFFNHPQQAGPVGGTPTASAIRAMYTSSTVSDQNAPSAGILITDGAPTNGISGDAQEDAVAEACAHQDVAPMYVIGFSAGTDTAFNNLLAAAGGTGTCSDDSGVVDPCAISPQQAVSSLTCTGSFQADTGNQFQQALDSITGQIACTYPLDVLGTPNGQAPDSGDGARVFLGGCNPAPAESTKQGGELFGPGTDGTSTSDAPVGLECNETCGVTDGSTNSRLTYLLPANTQQTNTVRVRIADYKQNCSTPLQINVRVENEIIGSWTSTGANEWVTLEFPYDPSILSNPPAQVGVTIEQINAASCTPGACPGACDPREEQLNAYVDWVKIRDPEAGCSASGALNYVPPGQSGSGWRYNQNRTMIELVGGACDQIQGSTVNQVTTQVACPCEYLDGTLCNPGAGSRCPTGGWECSAQWEDMCVEDETCDGECAQKTEHDTTYSSPNIQMVVDNSGSMGWGISGASGSRHNIARDQVASVADWSYQGGGCTPGAGNCDKVRLGVHFWSTSSNKEESAQEDFDGSDVRREFNQHPPSGGTYFHKAAELLQNENVLQDVTRPNFGLMITDGAPSGDWTLRQSLGTFCDLRSRSSAPVGTFVMGFGSGNNEQVNSLVAAAGGTGACCEGAGCDPTDDTQTFDVCDIKNGGPNGDLDDLARAIYYNNDNRYGGVPVTCTGNIPATNGAQLKSELIQLFGSLECAFPLELLPGETSAPANPEGTFVDLSLAGVPGVVSVPHVDDDPAQQTFSSQMNAKLGDTVDRSDEGWAFGNQGRTFVELTPGLCALINSQQIDQVDTQVCKADSCTQTGQSCVVACDGTEPFCDDDGNKVGRCRGGVFECVDNQDVCVQQRSAMPEICNGRDDSCDGMVDNLFDNETNWTEPEWSLQDNYNGEYNGYACFNRNVCVCPDQQPDPEGGEATDSDEYESMLANQKASGECVCAEGLDYTPDGRAYMPTYQAPIGVEPSGGCHVAGADESSGGAVLWLVGLLAVGGWKRRRGTRG